MPADSCAWFVFSDENLLKVLAMPAKASARARTQIAGWFLCFLALTIWSFRRLPFAVSLYGLGTLALPYLALGIMVNRYVLVCFPVFMCMAILCEGRPWLVSALIGIFAALLLQNAALFSQWYWVG
jgi:hypothetical protein